MRSTFRVLFGLVHLQSGSLKLRISRITNINIRSFLSGLACIEKKVRLLVEVFRLFENFILKRLSP